MQTGYNYVIVTAQCQSVIRVKVTDAFNIRQGHGAQLRW